MRNLRVFRIWAAPLALLMGWMSSTASAQTLMDRAKSEGLRVAFYNAVPYAYDKGSGLTGTDVDTLKAVLEAMGAKIQSVQATEWGNLIPGLKAGRFDVVAAGMFITPERCKQVRFSEPLFGVKHSFIVPKGNPKGIRSYDDIAQKGLTVAVLSGSAYVGYARNSGVPANKMVTFPDTPTAVAALRSGRADVIGAAATGSRDIVSKVPEQDLESTPPFSDVAGKPASPHGAFAFRPEDAAFVEQFNKVLVARLATGTHLQTLITHGLMKDELPFRTAEQLCSGE